MHEEKNSTAAARAATIARTFTELDADFIDQLDPQDPKVATVGSCCVAVHVDKGVLHAACLGDSRAVLARRGEQGMAAVDLTVDQTAKNASEVAAVEQRSGDERAFRLAPMDVIYRRMNAQKRVAGVLMVTRAFGDAYLKRETFSFNPFNKHLPYLTAEPVMTHHQLGAGDEFVVLASDGIWDHMSSQEVVDFVAERRAPPQPGRPAAKPARDLIEHVLDIIADRRSIPRPLVRKLMAKDRRAMHDDMTVIIVELQRD